MPIILPNSAKAKSPSNSTTTMIVPRRQTSANVPITVGPTPAKVPHVKKVDFVPNAKSYNGKISNYFLPNGLKLENQKQHRIPGIINTGSLHFTNPPKYSLYFGPKPSNSIK